MFRHNFGQWALGAFMSRTIGLIRWFLCVLQVIGNDLSANMPTFVPPNVKFEVDDVESPWLHQEKFDWIFCRYMAASIFDWPNLVNTIYEFVPPFAYSSTPLLPCVGAFPYRANPCI